MDNIVNKDLKSCDATSLRSFYSGRRVLVTGSTGFKGAWLCKLLLCLGAEVAGYALKPPTRPSLFDITKLNRKIKQVYADIRDRNALENAVISFRPEVVFHLAAQSIVIDSYKDPFTTYETNAMGTVNILDVVRKTNSVTSFVNITTDKVYEINEEDSCAHKEDDKLDGYDPYSNSKSCSELITHSYKRSFPFDFKNCSISTARAGNVIGGGDFSPYRILPDCLRSLIENDVMYVRNPASVRPYQHVLESITAYLLIAMIQDPKYGGTQKSGCYNIGPDKEDAVSTKELVTLFAEYWGSDFVWQAKSAKGPHEASYLRLNNTKIKQQLGWKPCWSVKEAVIKTVEWNKVWLSRGDKAATKLLNEQIDEYLNTMFHNKKT